MIKTKLWRSFVPSASIFVAALAIIVALSLKLLNNEGNTHSQLTTTTKQRQFLDWFTTNGGKKHPNVTLANFADSYGNGLAAVHAISKEDTILEIPEKIQISKQLVLQRLESLLVDNEDGHHSMPEGGANDNEIYSALSKMPDDMVITLALVVEGCLGEDSFFAPYLDILPNKIPPLLFTFREEELELLQDAQLSAMARHTSARLRHAWSTVLRSAANDLVDRTAATIYKSDDIDGSGNGVTPSRITRKKKQSCLSEASFRYFYAVVTSHVMHLDGTQYLVPMADQINHRALSRQEEAGVEHGALGDEKGKIGNGLLSSSPLLSFPSFLDYHRRNEKGDRSITVLADRKVETGQPIMEEYGRLDNSLYLVSFGFVPTNNPYHCVMLSLPALTDQLLQNVQLFLTARTVDGASESSQGDVRNSGEPVFCVRRDGSVMDDEESADIHTALLRLELQNQQQQRDNAPRRRQECLEAFGTRNRTLVQSMCGIVMKSGTVPAAAADAKNSYHSIMSTAAQKVLNAALTTMQQDLALLREKERLLSQEKARSDNDNDSTTKALLAISFRIEEKKVLQTIVDTATVGS